MLSDPPTRIMQNRLVPGEILVSKYHAHSGAPTWTDPSGCIILMPRIIILIELSPYSSSLYIRDRIFFPQEIFQMIPAGMFEEQGNV